MSVQAKFKCVSNKKNEGYEPASFNIELHPVIDGSEENKSFYAATPGGNILLSVVNESAAKQFAEGKEYYVNFQEA